MRNFYRTFYQGMQRVVCLKIYLRTIICVAAIQFSYTESSTAQGIIPTKGKEFWMGFPRQPNGQVSTKRCEIFVTSEVNTSGIVLIPQQGFSLPFTVTANQTTTVTIPVATVEHTANQITDNKGVQILTLDTVSVFAISFQQYSADASVIYPKQSLGTEYRISSYQGLSGYPSQFLVVATEDNTQFTITPKAATLAGNAVGVPFTVSLNAGQSYQVQASQTTGDFTGTTVIATDSSGSCRPFAVFSGTMCVNIPVGCTWCDILFEQDLPVTHWGKTYYSTPFASTTKYTLRILADQNNTVYSVDGGPSVTLNAGQFTELSNLTAAKCISSNKPISVTQYMQGLACAGAGDPAMMYLNAVEQKINQVTFSTVTSTVITQHTVNVIMNTSHLGQLKLDGVTVPPASFIPFPACGNISYAQLTLSQGSHTLEADSGFSAYTYGTGSAESYAYSVGSFSKSQPIQVDSVTCSSDTIQLGMSNSLFGSWWSTLDDPTDTIWVGPVLTLLPPIIPGIYMLHGNEYISGCEKIFYFSVEIPDPPQTWITSSSTITCQNNLVQLNSGTIPPTPGYIYTWTPATGLDDPNIPDPVLTATTSGWYHVSIASNNGCTPTVYDSIYVDVLPVPIPAVSAGGSQSICAGGSATLTAGGGVSYQWLPGNLTGDTVVVTPVVTSSYVVIVTDQNGCTNSDTVTVSVNQLPVASAGTDVSICSGAQATLTGSGGACLWMPGGMTSATVNVNPLITTNYILQVTDGNGCISYDSVLVNVNPLPNAYAGTDKEICINDVTTLTATGGIAYLWSPSGSVSSSISVSPSLTTAYIVSVTDINGCSNRDTVIVSVNALPVISAGANQSICSGLPASLNASGGAGYLWNPGNISGATVTVTPPATTNYIVTGTDSNGCVNTDTVLVLVNQLPVIDAGAGQVLCSGGNGTLTASGGISYLWMPGGLTGTTITVNPLVNTTYTVTGTDINGCVNSDSVSILVNPLPVASAGPDAAICDGAATTLSATGGISYSWSPGGGTSASISVSPVATTNYIVSVIDANGCENQDSVLVIVYALPLVSAGPDQAICAGSNINLGASGAASYIWFPGNLNGSAITVSPVSSTSYIVTGTDSNGCSNSDVVMITVNPLPVVNIGGDQTICSGLQAVLSAGGGNLYSWNPGGMQGATVNVWPVVTTQYTVTVTDNNGCVSSAVTTVYVNPLPVANAGPDQFVCPGDQATMVASGGIGYLWMPGSVTGNVLTVTPSGIQSYVLTVTDNNGCTDTDTVVVGLEPLPVAAFTLQAPVCAGTAFVFSNNSTVTSGSIVGHSWDFGDGTIGTDVMPSHIYTSAGPYLVSLSILTDAGCTSQVSHMLTVNPLPAVDFTTQPQCAGLPVLFTDLSDASPNGIVKWIWDFGDGATSWWDQHPAHVYSNPGWYTIGLTIVTDSGCVSGITRPNAVEVFQLPEARFSYTPSSISIMDPRVYFRDLSLDATSWWWQFGDGVGQSDIPNPVYAYSDTGIYVVSLEIINQEGCRDTAYGEVFIEPDFTLYIPNAFTPNGDGINENFNPSGIGIRTYDLLIFDRWGSQVFSSSNLSKGWDGRSANGTVCMQGVYVYTIRVLDYKNSERQYTGQVSLIR